MLLRRIANDDNITYKKSGFLQNDEVCLHRFFFASGGRPESIKT